MKLSVRRFNHDPKKTMLLCVVFGPHLDESRTFALGHNGAARAGRPVVECNSQLYYIEFAWSSCHEIIVASEAAGRRFSSSRAR